MINMLKLIPVITASFKKLATSFDDTLLELKNLPKSIFVEGFFIKLSGTFGMLVPVFKVLKFKGKLNFSSSPATKLKLENIKTERVIIPIRVFIFDKLTIN